jgi:hypothetical protein
MFYLSKSYKGNRVLIMLYDFSIERIFFILPFLILRVTNQVVLGPGEAITLDTPGYNLEFLPGCQVQIVGFVMCHNFIHNLSQKSQNQIENLIL